MAFSIVGTSCVLAGAYNPAINNIEISIFILFIISLFTIILILLSAAIHAFDVVTVFSLPFSFASFLLLVCSFLVHVFGIDGYPFCFGG